jgi:RHS repeat-associated protein
VNLKHKYTGQEEDAETGLYYYGARYYDPAIGRFISPDIIVPDPGDPQDLNRYTYVGNNPLLYIDPTGHFKLKNLFKSALQGFVTAATFATAIIIEVGTWGTGTPLATALTYATASEMATAGAIAGAVGGGLSAGMEGGNIAKDALIGATIGGITGGITGSITSIADRQAFGIFMLGIGAGVSYAKGGIEGLANFGAGFVGAIAGAYTINWIADPPTSQVVNLDKMMKWMRDHAKPNYTGRCARHFRLGLEAGGVDTTGTPASGKAGEYGPFLEKKLGWNKVSLTTSYVPKVGDAAVFTPVNETGHIQAWDGRNWISDTIQPRFLPNRTWKDLSHTIYRQP